MATDYDKCPLCELGTESGSTRVDRIDDWVFLFGCSCCGPFIITREDIDDYLVLEHRRERFHPRRLSALVREASIRGRPVPWIQFGSELRTFEWNRTRDFVASPVKELLRRWPATMGERFDRAICNLSILKGLQNFDENETAVVFAEAPNESLGIVEALVKLDFVEGVGSLYRVTPQGHARADEFERGRSSAQNPAFMAQWFGGDDHHEEMDALYNDGVLPAVKLAGYHVDRVDKTEFNDDIMDQIISMIRAAPFVVADFTGDRGGVYYEAGFARGQGIPVIHTCKKSDFKKMHFDVQQMNFILWEQPADLVDRLQNRILRVLGRGPFASDEQ